jgi:dinuclear metal center protein, ybgI family
VADGIRDYLREQSDKGGWNITVQSFENQADFFFE